MKPEALRVAVIGAGSRGTLFGELIAASGLARITAVAEPQRSYREQFAARHGVAAAATFRSWEQLCAAPAQWDAAVVTTLDQDHAAPAIACLRHGWHLLLEKPMATTLADCEAIAAAAAASGVVTSVCHSMRYGAPFRKLKQIVAGGRLGRVITIDQLEQVGMGASGAQLRARPLGQRGTRHLHAHGQELPRRRLPRLSGRRSLPRGQLVRRPDLLPSRPRPPASGERCVACAVEPECGYSALRHYVDTDREAWPASTISFDHSRAAHLQAITDGPYGRCVWKTDNDVVDHQVVAMEFAGQITATLTMTGFTHGGGRRVRVQGTEAEAELSPAGIEVRNFGDGVTERITLPAESGGHGGGDRRVVDAWLRAIAAGAPQQVVTDVATSLQTHRIVFAAERARRERRVIELATPNP